MMQKELVWPYMQKWITIAFDINLTDKQKELEIEKLANEVKAKASELMTERYPDVIFNVNEEMPLENSIKDNIEVSNSRERHSIIELWQYWIFTDSIDSWNQLKIKVNSVQWIWWEKKESFMIHNAKNEYLSINLQSENIWKKPYFVSFSDMKLVTNEWIEYNPAYETRQEWWCITCESNPWDINKQPVVFDIKKIALSWAKLVNETYKIEFKLD